MHVFSFASTRARRKIIVAFFIAACALATPVTARAATTPSSADANFKSALEAAPVQRFALQLARDAATHFLKTGQVLALPKNLPAPLKKRAGVIVTYEKRGQIAPRGCRGTLQPQRENLASEIVFNAIAAATRDTRVKPLQSNELEKCRISLTVITQMRPLRSLAEHDAANCGIIAQRGEKIGLVLPYEGRDAATQWRWAKQKAGLRETDSAQMMEVVAARFRES